MPVIVAELSAEDEELASVVEDEDEAFGAAVFPLHAAGNSPGADPAGCPIDVCILVPFLRILNGSDPDADVGQVFCFFLFRRERNFPFRTDKGLTNRAS